MEQLHVRWRVSRRDLLHGVPRDVVPHVVTGLVGLAWVLAPHRGGAAAFLWLGALVLVVQVGAVARVVLRHVAHARGAEQVLTVLEGAYVVTDRRGATTYDSRLTGAVDDHGVLRLEFADGRVLEAPWRAFTHAGLRRLRRHLRAELGAREGLAHVPVRRVGAVTGTGAWPRPLLALLVAVALGALPWLVAPPA